MEKTHPSYTQVLATEVEQVHGSNCVIGCLRRIIFYESVTPVTVKSDITTVTTICTLTTSPINTLAARMVCYRY